MNYNNNIVLELKRSSNNNNIAIGFKQRLHVYSIRALFEYVTVEWR